jgi:hypothetical protein
VITTPTTIVVGAGASKPYGLPLGFELLREAKRARENRGRPTYDLLLHAFRTDDVLRVIEDLESWDGPSIDEFMLTRSDDAVTQLICKGAIAGLLGDAIRRSQVSPTSHAWIELVADKILEGASSFGSLLEASRVRFVTFNFDSVVETVLLRKVRARFREGEVKETSLFDAVPVIHVHGRLPDPPSHLPSPVATHGLADGQWADWIAAAAESVAVISDQINDDALVAARAAVSSASVLCFLGFSFHPVNIRRLGLPLSDDGASTRVFAATTQAPRGQLQAFANRIGRPNYGSLWFGEEEESCWQVLRRFPVFVD